MLLLRLQGAFNILFIHVEIMLFVTPNFWEASYCSFLLNFENDITVFGLKSRLSFLFVEISKKNQKIKFRTEFTRLESENVNVSNKSLINHGLLLNLESTTLH